MSLCSMSCKMNVFFFMIINIIYPLCWFCFWFSKQYSCTLLSYEKHKTNQSTITTNNSYYSNDLHVLCTLFSLIHQQVIEIYRLQTHFKWFFPFFQDTGFGFHESTVAMAGWGKNQIVEKSHFYFCYKILILFFLFREYSRTEMHRNYWKFSIGLMCDTIASDDDEHGSDKIYTTCWWGHQSNACGMYLSYIILFRPLTILAILIDQWL